MIPHRGKHFRNNKEPGSSAGNKKKILTALLLMVMAALVVFLMLSAGGGKRPSAPQESPLSADLKEASPDKALSGDIKSGDVKSETPVSGDVTKKPDKDGKTDEKHKPLLAVIVDDGGSDTALAKRLAALRLPLTWAVLPYQKNSTVFAELALDSQIPFLCHLPMQAVSDTESSQYIIGVRMPYGEVMKKTARALDSLPGAIGINNHRGSRATEDRTLMEPVMEELKKRALIFVDSRTSKESRAYGTALDASIPALKNNLFLDNRPDKAEIKKRLNEAVQLARKNGSAVVICHFRPVTVEFLEELSQNYKKLPVKIVTVPELLLIKKMSEQMEEAL